MSQHDEVPPYFEEHYVPNARDCEHGQLRRSCPLCEKDAEIARLHNENIGLAGMVGVLELAVADLRARAEIAALHVQLGLRELEWSGHAWILPDGTRDPSCPLCHGWRSEGHASDCRIAAALKEQA